ncbi:hypothetical protein [Chakrabartyella piscis]|uniref:hypothetical protein n=1 Tax=Chakrabartyella piscis TaxID=2918914 RepID=UPI0029587322|nr:hypothetical protein [Chakrabartyella piscis]
MKIGLQKTAAVVLSFCLTSQCMMATGFAIEQLPAANGLVAVNTSFDSLAYWDDGSYDASGESTGIIPVTGTSIQANLMESDDTTEQIMGYDAYGRGIISVNTPLVEEWDEAVLMETIGTIELGTTYSFSVAYSYYSDQYVEFEVIAVGDYSNIWVPKTEMSDFRLTTEEAEKLAEEYDEVIYPALVKYFGGFENADKDKDGKVNILCYDIDGDGENTYGSYTGGYFDSGELLKGLDILHVDSAQGMHDAYGEYVGVSQTYSTVAHELQHMIAYSVYMVKDSYQPTFLNEAFSMAAEHLIYGVQDSRIDYYNGSSAIAVGSVSLAYWGDSLDDYALSYLFGQYLRTQYAQQDGVTNGDAIYKDLYEILLSEKYFYKDVLIPLTELVGADSTEELFLNFYAALAEKGATGVYGFNGENWAEDIYPQYLNVEGPMSLKEGCAVYFGAYDAFTPSEQGEHIQFKALDVIAGSADIPVVKIDCQSQVVENDTITVKRGDTVILEVVEMAGYKGSLFYNWIGGETVNYYTSLEDLNHRSETYTVDTSEAGQWMFACYVGYGTYGWITTMTPMLTVVIEDAPNVNAEIASTTATTTKVTLGRGGYDGYALCAIYDEDGKCLDVAMVESEDNQTWQTDTVTLNGVGEVRAFATNEAYGALF